MRIINVRMYYDDAKVFAQMLIVRGIRAVVESSGEDTMGWYICVPSADYHVALELMAK